MSTNYFFYMKRIIVSAAIAALVTVSVFAGGLMTNTNYHIAFDRMFARGATTEIDAVFSNPAGLAWGHEGWQLSLNFQKPWQNRDVEININNFLANPAVGNPGETFHKKYNGEASAPIVPALFASYKKDRWAVSAMIGIVGSGGFVEYDEGVPMFNVPITAKIYSTLFQTIAATPYAAQADALARDFILDSSMKGKQYIYGGQVNFTYRIIDCLSAAVGFRTNYYDGYYKGHVTAMPGQNIAAMVGNNPLMDLQLDCVQRGWGFTPIISADFHMNKWTVAMRYEFRTKINTENDTRTLTVGTTGTNGYSVTDVKAMAEQYGNAAVITALSAPDKLGDMAGKVADYLPNEHTRYDMPSLFVAAVGYEFTPSLRAATEFHFFDDKNAKMGGQRQEKLSHGTYEVLAGVEWDINKKFTVSCGGQRTDYGLTDDYQQNTSFACDSWSLGLGGAWNINEKIRLNASYFCSLYSDYNKTLNNAYSTPYTVDKTYSRTNHVIGVGVDYKF